MEGCPAARAPGRRVPLSTVHVFAEKNPDKPALIFENGETVVTYGELEQRSRRLGQALRRAGLETGDGIALLMANEDPFYEIFWCAMRTGLYFTPINWHLQDEEVRYIVQNSDARVFLASPAQGDVAIRAAATLPPSVRKVSVGGEIEGFERVEDLLADVPEDSPLEDSLEGALMLYSSGTTGQPKGVRQPLSGKPAGDPATVIAVLGLAALFGFKETDHYLSPAPLYHAAPLIFSSGQHRIGATTVIMRRFEAERALQLIQDQKVDTSQWVPTHFRRMLQLPEEVRRSYDLSTHRVAVHAAAPCPVPVKQAMIEWWGPILMEYYAGTEGGGTLIRSEEWLEHPGSVGRHWTGGTLHILDEEGNAVSEPEVDGLVYFEGPEEAAARFRYHKDEEKTRGSYRGRLFTLGDIGHVDKDGYLYLTDRQSNMIISGGANIYPQETENLLLSHPKVDDVAVIGVPNEDMGEEVKAVVIPRPGVDPGPELERELIDFCRERIAHYKCPRTVDFSKDLPRQPTGKLYKRLIREKYWGDRGLV
jgi:acyl-coenzyme A synthetase/AMP-(fatty) acid ligase